LPAHAAEDALQDAIVLVLQRTDASWLAQFLAASPKEQIGYFLSAIHNNALKAILRNRLDPLPEIPCEDETAPNPAREAERTDTRRAVREAIQRLPKAQREVMELDMEEYTDAEITGKLHISPGATRKRRFDAGENMRKILQSQDISY
jgi:RNA polymerase sigma factor (sigma-70 family)